ncbi:hypothetical protein Anas_02556, partial [Armadillidium nasatum]
MHIRDKKMALNILSKSSKRLLPKFEIRYKYLKYFSEYTQGQYPPNDKKSREYFYYIDHLGMFLKFFFSRIQLNTFNRYENFPFVSLCGRERNFIRCDDLPIVYNQLITLPTDSNLKTHLCYGNAGSELTFPFEPRDICMVNETGRVYHPAPEKMGGVGLVASKLAVLLSSHFIFQNGDNNPPTHIKWENEVMELSQKSYDA